jgi:hypothetical protein
MKLNIINHNPEITDDLQYVDELIKMFTNVKEKLSSQYYTSYQKFLLKINKFMDMITPNIQKELDELASKKTFFDESDESDNDNISIASISEYEDDDDCNEIDELEIKKYEDVTKNKLFESNDRFDFQFVKICKNELI